MDQKLNSFSIELIEGLTTFCSNYLKECLHFKSGYNVIYMVDATACKFESYLSTHFELGSLIVAELSKEESTNKIVYVIDCEGFRNYNKDEISEMAYNMAFVLFGMISNLTLKQEFKLPDDTDYFISKSLI